MQGILDPYLPEDGVRVVEVEVVLEVLSDSQWLGILRTSVVSCCQMLDAENEFW